MNSINLDKLATYIHDGHMVLAMGNGGSAAECGHLVGELLGRYKSNRKPYAAVNLCDPSVITCIANDFGYKYVFSRQIEGFRDAGLRDVVVVAFSTSGNSKNIVEALKYSKAHNIPSFLFTGEKPGKASKYASHIVSTPHPEVAVIQEGHLSFIHQLCDRLEQ